MTRLRKEVECCLVKAFEKLKPKYAHVYIFLEACAERGQKSMLNSNATHLKYDFYCDLGSTIEKKFGYDTFERSKFAFCNKIDDLVDVAISGLLDKAKMVRKKEKFQKKKESRVRRLDAALVSEI